MKLIESIVLRSMRSRAKYENRGLGIFPQQAKDSGWVPTGIACCDRSIGYTHALTASAFHCKTFLPALSRVHSLQFNDCPATRTEYVPRHHFCFTAGHILTMHFTHNMQTSGARPCRSARSYQSVIRIQFPAVLPPPPVPSVHSSPESTTSDHPLSAVHSRLYSSSYPL